MWKQISSVIVIALILVSYNHCGMPKGSKNKKLQVNKSKSVDNSSNSGNPSSAWKPSDDSSVEVINDNIQDIEIFSKTLWPLTKMRCASCHNSSQQPLHASSDVNIAYKAVIDGFKVNFSNPSSSRMVLKLEDENHNCWSNCTDNSRAILDQVSIWAQQREVTTKSENSTSDSFITEESMTLDKMLDFSNTSGVIRFDSSALNINKYFSRAKSGNVDYIYTKGAGSLKSSSDNRSGTAFINFTTRKTAGYKVWALVNAKASADDSFYVKFNDEPYIQWDIPETNGFEWRVVTHKGSTTPSKFFAPQGSPNKLEIKQREDGTKISSIVLSDEIERAEELLNINTTATFRFDISSMLNLTSNTVLFEIDCRSFDEYTYQFLKPRITSTSSSNIKLKGIKLHINGSYNPQHSTYSYLDTNISRGTTVLSESALLAIKERGSGSDRFSFSFDKIELK